jgi:hypothetical protein
MNLETCACTHDGHVYQLSSCRWTDISTQEQYKIGLTSASVIPHKPIERLTLTIQLSLEI